MTEYKKIEENINLIEDPFSDYVLRDSADSSNQLFYRDDERGIWLFKANSLELMDRMIKKFPDGRFDVIFADPPYFLSNDGFTCHAGKMVKVNKGDWDKSKGAEVNHEFNLEWLRRCQALLKENGTIWVSGTHHVIHSVGFAMQQLGMKLLNDITWEKPNPPPNLSCRFFTHSTETIIWAAKNEKSKHTFNYQDMRDLNEGKQMKTVWKFTAPGKNEKEFGKHPTQKPISLVERCILASSMPRDMVYDPFNGSSTTGVAAVKNGRYFVGSELDVDYLNLSVKRLEAIKLTET